jgi:hypothetical protein
MAGIQGVARSLTSDVSTPGASTTFAQRGRARCQARDRT